MNNHFEDSRYHVRRAGQELRAGAEIEFDRLRRRVASRLGRTSEPEEEPSRLDGIRERFEAMRSRAEFEAHNGMAAARRRFGGWRQA